MLFRSKELSEYLKSVPLFSLEDIIPFENFLLFCKIGEKEENYKKIFVKDLDIMPLRNYYIRYVCLCILYLPIKEKKMTFRCFLHWIHKYRDILKENYGATIYMHKLDTIMYR